MEGKIGVLALQGDVLEHCAAFRAALEERCIQGPPQVCEVHRPGDLDDLAALAIPGGESTTISRLIEKNHLFDAITEFEGGIFATCAGMVLMATDPCDTRVNPLSLMDMTVQRNAFGRQRDSFEADIEVSGLKSPFHAVFIRAPAVSSVGVGVEVLSQVPTGAVAVRKGYHMALSFHPELGGDLRLHHLFLDGLQDICAPHVTRSSH